MKKRMTLLLVLALTAGLAAAVGAVAAPQPAGAVQECFVDDNGDGRCDNRGAGYCTNAGRCYVEENRDNACDNGKNRDCAPQRDTGHHGKGHHRGRHH